MPVIKYKDIKFRGESEALIGLIADIVDEYEAIGYELTLRQLYYQLVARDYIPNTDRSYKNIGELVNRARLAGLLDWEAIVDRTRYLRTQPHWDSPADIVESAAVQYQIDKWERQPNYIEVWVEKDALIDVVGKACEPYDVPHFSCRGYVSQSEMWRAAERFNRKRRRRQQGSIHLIHLGDHDPSGIDMTRDITERLELFQAEVTVHRIALTREQIEEFAPPPNPAKVSDSRYHGYVRQHGRSSWELDALDPVTLTEIIQNEIERWIKADNYETDCAREERDRAELYEIAKSLKGR